jgi:hypothetical protein
MTTEAETTAIGQIKTAFVVAQANLKAISTLTAFRDELIAGHKRAVQNQRNSHTKPISEARLLNAVFELDRQIASLRDDAYIVLSQTIPESGPAFRAWGMLMVDEAVDKAKRAVTMRT